MRISDWSSDVCSSDLILPRARGEALRVVQGAEAYKERLENEAEGEAQRFLSVYNAYRQNPDVTRRRMYLETMQGILSDTDKVILDGQAGSGGVLPYLPLNELRRTPGATPRSEEHTSELQSLMRTSYAVFCLKHKTNE